MKGGADAIDSDHAHDSGRAGACHGRAPEAYLPEGGTAGREFHHTASLPVKFEYGTVDCSQCHMPRSLGKLVQLSSFKNLEKREIGDHRFASNHYEQLADGLAIAVDGPAGKVVLTNQGLGHPLKICPGTRYRLVLTVRKGKQTLETRSLPLDGVEQLAPGGQMEFSLAEGPLPSGRISLSFFVTRSPSEDERQVFGKTL